MCASIGVIFDSVDDMLSRQVALVIDDSYPPLVSTTSVSHCDLSCVVPASQMLSLACNGEFEKRSSFPQVVVHRSFKMAQTRRTGLVCSEGDEFLLPRGFALRNGAAGRN